MGLPDFTAPPRRFSGGLNLNSEEVDVNYEQLIVAKNCRIKQQTIRTGPGFIKYSNTSLSGKVKFIWGDLINSLYKLVIAAGDKIVSASGGIYTTLKSGLNVGAGIDMDLYNKRLFIGNGVDANMKYNGTIISNHGIVAPGNFTVSEVNPGTGVFPNGQRRQFFITYWDDNNKVESNPNASSQGLTIAAGPSNISLNLLPATTDTNVTHYRVYMTEDFGDTFLRKSEILYATYVGLSYVIPNSTNGTLELEFDNNPPGIYYQVEYYKNRLYVVETSNKAFLKFSKEYRPEQFPLDFRLGLGDAYDEQIRCAVKLYDYLIIGTNRGMWVLDGDPLINNARPKRATGYVGIASAKGYAIQDNFFMYVGVDKRIYALDPTQFSNSDIRPNYISKPIEKLLKKIDSNTISDAVGIFYHHEDRYEALFSVDIVDSALPTPGVLNTVLVYDADEKAWSTDDKRITAFGLVTSSDNDIDLYHGDENGYVYLANRGLGYGAVINASATSATTTTITDTAQAAVISTATSGGAATLTDTTQTLTANQYLNYQIFISAGTGVGQYRTISGNTPTVFTVSTAWTIVPDATSQYIVGGFTNGTMSGLDVTVNGGTGNGQRRVVSSHTPITVTVDSTWSEVPNNTSTFSIGAIDFEVWTGWDTHTQTVEHTKRGWFFHISTQETGNYSMTFSYAIDLVANVAYDYTIGLYSAGALWGVSLWGVGLWSSAGNLLTNITFDGNHEYYQRVQQRFKNSFAGQPILINYLCVTGQDKGMML